MKILFLVSRLPYPLEKGDKLRAFYQLKGLSKFHDVHLFALSDTDVHPDAHNMLMQYCKSVRTIRLSEFCRTKNVVNAFIKGLPIQVGYFYSEEAKQLLEEEIKIVKPDVIYCQLLRTAQYVLDIKNIPKVIDYQDVFSEGMKRRAMKESYFLRPFFNLEFERLKKYENKIFDDFNKHLIISSPDRDKIIHHDREKINLIPNGVDTTFYRKKDIGKQYDILFTGNMQYAPNVLGAEFLVRQILPVLLQHQPKIKILIAGAHPVKRVRDLESDIVKISGWIPDIREAYNKSKIFVAPMLIGTGLQNKLLEAMAMQLPCITSPLANNALEAPENKCILIANNAEEYVSHINELLQNPGKAKVIADNGYQFVSEKYNWDNIIGDLSKILESARV